MRKRLAIVIFGFFTTFYVPAASGQESTATMEFVQKAAVGNLFEVASSELAVQRTQRPDVREFAQQMIADHTAAADEMQSVMEQAGLDLSTLPQALDPRHAAIVTALTAAAAEEFDSVYIREQKTAHDEAVELYQDYVNAGDNAALREFAAATLPTLRHHREQVYQFTEVALGN